MENVTEDLKLALRLADAADKISLTKFQSQNLIIETKPDFTPVTDADREVEKEITRILDLERPEDSIIGEEFGNKNGGKRCWIIDPIDGTANFLRKVPIWATLIALRVEGEYQLSVVSAPALGLRWWAAPGVGAIAKKADGKEHKLRVSKVSELSSCYLSYNSLQGWQNAGYLKQLLNLSEKVWRTRAFGDFYSYMLLAEGVIDAVSEHGLQIYDIAALVPIVTQAGGKFTSITGELEPETSAVLATNGLLHQEITSLLVSRNKSVG